MVSHLKMTEGNLKDPLESVYQKGQETENISVLVLIDEIKKQFRSYTTK